jgi:hypothetical protein
MILLPYSAIAAFPLRIVTDNTMATQMKTSTRKLKPMIIYSVFFHMFFNLEPPGFAARKPKTAQ